MKLDIDEFIKGQRDCRDGHPSACDASESYLRGYSAQYHIEQDREYFSREHFRIKKTT